LGVHAVAWSWGKNILLMPMPDVGKSNLMHCCKLQTKARFRRIESDEPQLNPLGTGIFDRRFFRRFGGCVRQFGFEQGNGIAGLGRSLKFLGAYGVVEFGLQPGQPVAHHCRARAAQGYFPVVYDIAVHPAEQRRQQTCKSGVTRRAPKAALAFEIALAAITYWAAQGAIVAAPIGRLGRFQQGITFGVEHTGFARMRITPSHCGGLAGFGQSDEYFGGNTTVRANFGERLSHANDYPLKLAARQLTFLDQCGKNVMMGKRVIWLTVN
jgi:hypothetical protein